MRIRVVQVDPVYVEGQVHTLGLEHVPPFEQLGVQTVIRKEIVLFSRIFRMNLRNIL